MQKYLLIFIIILIPLAVISFSYQETNFFNEEALKNNNSQPSSNPIMITLNQKNEKLYIPLEEYLIGVIAAEMPASFHEEALKAQAIAARTYAYKKTLKNQTLTGTTADQAYITTEQMQEKWGPDYQLYKDKITKCVEETKNLIILYENQPIDAFYFSMSNGTTENAQTVFNQSLPYLKSVSSPWEQKSRNYIVSKEYSVSEICELLKKECTSLTIRNPKYSLTNHLETIEINGNTYTGLELRKLLSLRSTDIKITIQDKIVKITTTGYGHGVGMSQYGADGMAKSGHNFEEILTHYYTNTKIDSINV